MKTKFKIGDTVYYNDTYNSFSGQVTKGRVSGIMITEDRPYGHLEIRYKLDSLEDCYSISEEFVYKTPNKFYEDIIKDKRAEIARLESNIIDLKEKMIK